MRLTRFDFAAPTSLDEALGLLAGPRKARPLAGGTDLIDQLRTGRRSADLVVDLKRIPELQRLDADADGLHIGGTVSCTDVHHDRDAQARYAGVAEACGLIGSVQIQNRAALAGNVCNAAPSADSAPCLIAHGARAVIAARRGVRDVPLEDFFTGPGESVLEKGELLTEVVLPPPAEHSASAYLRFTPRNEMDIAVAGVGCYLELDPASGLALKARIVLAAVAPTPLRARAAEAVLEGKSVSDELIERAGREAVAAARPISDVRGSADYRRELVAVLTRRTLGRCLARIAGAAGL